MHGDWVLAPATCGHSAAVVLGWDFCGSYAYMISFVTIMIGRLYALPHELTAEILPLRREEAAIDAGCGRRGRRAGVVGMHVVAILGRPDDEDLFEEVMFGAGTPAPAPA